MLFPFLHFPASLLSSFEVEKEYTLQLSEKNDQYAKMEEEQNALLICASLRALREFQCFCKISIEKLFFLFSVSPVGAL